MIINQIENIDVFEFLESLKDESVDLAIIDPPYNRSVAEWDAFKSQEDFFTFTKKYLQRTASKLKPSASLYIFNTAFNAAFILQILLELKMQYQNWIIWYKKDGFSPSRKRFVNNQETILFFTKTETYKFFPDNVRVPYLSSSRIKAAKEKGILKNGKRWFPNPNGKLCTDVWEFTSVRHNKKIDGKTMKQPHPTPKPEAMIERMIKASSEKGDLILDLFSGTGTTAFVAKKLGRNFIGCENNTEYFELIQRRLNNE